MSKSDESRLRQIRYKNVIEAVVEVCRWESSNAMVSVKKEAKTCRGWEMGSERRFNWKWRRGWAEKARGNKI